MPHTATYCTHPLIGDNEHHRTGKCQQTPSETGEPGGGWEKRQRRILMPIFFTGRAAGYHIADLIITTEPINRRFGSPDTFHFPKMTKVDTIHGLPSQRHWNNESFTIKHNTFSFKERMANIPIRPSRKRTMTFFQAIQSQAAP